MDRNPYAQPAPLEILPSPPRCPGVMPLGSDWNRFMNESEWDSSMMDAIVRLQTRYTIVSESSDSWSVSGQSPAGEQTDEKTTFDSLEALSTMAQRESAAAMLPLVKAGCVFLIKDRGPISKMVRPDYMSFLVFFTVPKPYQYWCSLGPSYDHPWLLETGRHMARITELPGESEEGRDARMRLADHYKALSIEGKIDIATLCQDPEHRASYSIYRYSRQALVAYKHPAFATAVAQHSTLAAASSGQAADQGGRGLPGLQSTVAESKSAEVERGQIPQTFADVKTASSSTSVKPADASVSGSLPGVKARGNGELSQTSADVKVMNSNTCVGPTNANVFGSLPGEKVKVVGRGQVSETSADVKTDTGNTSVRPRDATLPGSPPYKKAKVAD
ncbi:MAG: hypothetical protein Q9162_000236 [Coniocarpon cinnabarinum]